MICSPQVLRLVTLSRHRPWGECPICEELPCLSPRGRALTLNRHSVGESGKITGCQVVAMPKQPAVCPNRNQAARPCTHKLGGVTRRCHVCFAHKATEVVRRNMSRRAIGKPYVTLRLSRRSPISSGQFGGSRASPLLPRSVARHVLDRLFEGCPNFTLTKVPIPKLSHKAN